MARTRKESASDAAHRKTVARLAKAAEEQARLAKAAEDALPNTDLVSEMQRQDDIARRIIGVEPVAEFQQDKIARQVAGLGPVTQEAGIAQQVAAGLEPVTQDAEIKRLMQLPLSQVKALPQEQKKMVWEEMARQVLEMPVTTDMMTSLAEIGRRAVMSTEEMQSQWRRLSELAEQTIVGLSAARDSIWRSISNLLSDDAEEAMGIWEILEPYIEAEADEHPELYGEEAETPASGEYLLAAAARRARADGKEIPPLKVDALDEKARTKSRRIKEAYEQRKLAQSEGTITTFDGRVATVADKKLQFCFTSRDLKKLPGDRDSFLFDSMGKLNEFSLGDKKLQPLDDIHTGFLMFLLQVANCCDIREYNSKDNPSIGIYLPAFFRESHIDPRPRKRIAEKDKKGKTRKVLKSREPVGDDQTVKQERLQRFIAFMKPLDNRVGIIEGEGYYSVARFLSWDEKTDTAYIAIPFEIKLAEIARLHADRHSAIKTIFRADIMKENQAAVELANRIAVGVIQRGVKTPDSSTYKNATARKLIKKKTTKTAADGTKTTEELTFSPEPDPDVTMITKSQTDENGVTTTVTGARKKEKTYTWRAQFSTLIAECPQLQRELDEIRNGTGPKEAEAVREGKTEAEIKTARRDDHKHDSQRTNKKMKDTFTAAIRIIMENSDVPRYYMALTIKTRGFDKFVAPTNSTVNTELVITHRGKNPAFVNETISWDAV